MNFLFALIVTTLTAQYPHTSIMKKSTLLAFLFIAFLGITSLLSSCNQRNLEGATQVSVKIENFSMAPEYRTNYSYMVRPDEVVRTPVEPTTGAVETRPYSQEEFDALVGKISGAGKAYENDCDGCNFVEVKVYKGMMMALELNFAGSDGNDKWWEVVDLARAPFED